MDVSDSVWTIVVAAGSGERFGRRKQYEELGGRRVLDWALSVASDCSDGVVLVLPADDVDPAAPNQVAGGATRSESVRNGLAVVPADAGIICVHDAARPFASHELFRSVIDAVRSGADGVVPALPVADTIKVVGPDGRVLSTPDRASLVSIQTPQGFRASALRAAHAAGGVRGPQRRGAEPLRGLDRHQRCTVGGAQHAAVGAHHLDGVGHRQRRHHTVGTGTDRVDHAAEQFVRGEGSCGVVHTDDAGIGRHDRKTVAHGLAPCCPAGNLVRRSRVDVVGREHEDHTVGAVAGDR